MLAMKMKPRVWALVVGVAAVVAVLSEANKAVSDARKNADEYSPKIKDWCRSQLTLPEKEQLIEEFEAFVRVPKKSEKEHIDCIVRFFQQQGVYMDMVRILDFESVARGLGVQHPQFLLRSPKKLLEKMLSSFSFSNEADRGHVRRLLEQGLEKNEVFHQLAVLAFYKNGTPLHLGERLEALSSPSELDRQLRFCQAGWSVVGKSNRCIPYMEWCISDVYWFRTLLPGPGAFPSEFAWPTYFFFWRKFAHLFDLGFVSLANLDTDATMTELAPCVQSFTLSAGAEKLLATSEGRQKLAHKCRIPLKETQVCRFLPAMTRLMADYLWGHTRNLFSILGVGLVKLRGQRTLVINQFSELSMSVHQGLPFRCTRLKCFRGAMGGRRELDQRKEKCLARYLKVGRPDDLYRPLVELQGVPYEAYLKQQEAAQVTDVDY